MTKTERMALEKKILDIYLSLTEEEKKLFLVKLNAELSK